MEQDGTKDFEPSFDASVSQFGLPDDAHGKVTLLSDRILIDGPLSAEIPLDEVDTIEIVLLTVEPYWFLANSVAFLPLMNDRMGDLYEDLGPSSKHVHALNVPFLRRLK